MRANLAVGPPLDLLVARHGEARAELVYRIEPENFYFHALSESWGRALELARVAIPPPPFRPKP